MVIVTVFTYTHVTRIIWLLETLFPTSAAALYLNYGPLLGWEKIVDFVHVVSEAVVGAISHGGAV